MIVNENIIRNALNESIDEFLLEEGIIDEINWGGGIKGAKDWWNNSANGQKVKNRLSKAWNGVKNAAAMYMDYRTNGQWNNKYGIYANGNGKTTELYYLNKWFNTHLNNIQRIEYQNNEPSGNFSKKREYVERNGEKVYFDDELQYDNLERYVEENITADNFNNWVNRFIKNRQALSLIDRYIEKCQNKITDYKSAMNLLRVSSFMADETGQQYLQLSNQQLSDQRNEYELQRIKNLIPQWQKWFMENFKNRTTKEFGNVYQNFAKSKYIPQSMKKFITYLVNYSIKNNNSDILKHMTYKNFLRYYGKYYNM